MAYSENRKPEGHLVDEQALGVFSRVSSWTGPLAAHRVKHIIGDKLTSGMKILDIGTGPGAIPLNLRKRYPNVHFFGTDISSAMIRNAKAYAMRADLQLPLLVGDGESLPFGTGTLDGVISLFAMHHMDRPERLLHEIDRVLKPGGLLLIIDFRRDMSRWLFTFINAIWRLIFIFSAARKGFAESALSAWTQDEIQRILEKEDIRRFKVRTNKMELWVTTE